MDCRGICFHQLTGVVSKTSHQNRIACVICLILLAIGVCLCHVEDHVDEYPNVCISISLELLFKALFLTYAVRWARMEGKPYLLFTRFYQWADFHLYLYMPRARRQLHFYLCPAVAWNLRFWTVSVSQAYPT